MPRQKQDGLFSQQSRIPWIAAGVALSIAAGSGAPAAAAPRPTGAAGPAADALAREMMAAVDHEAWQRTGAVGWTFRGQREHLWDRRRMLARVRWDGFEVLVDLTARRGRAFRGGREVTARKARKLVRKAWEAWINDSFWLNPVVKLFDDGTTRSLVKLEEGGRGLLVEYATGGATPGDAYLWIVGEDALPTSWRMWTSNLPVGGTRASWEEWLTLATGARVATFHKLALGTVRLSDVEGGATLGEVEPGPDPFAALVAGAP